MKWYVYLLLCDKKTFYVGMTDNLERRVLQHRRKESPYTKKFLNIELAHFEKYSSRRQAEKRELQIKKWSITKKKALITGNVLLLKKLSKSSEIVDVSSGRK